MKGKGLLKRVFSVVMALILVISMISVTEPKKAEAATDEWVLTPSDHTPATGVEVPKNVSAIKKIAYTSDADQRTGSTATIADGMALVGENMYTSQIQYSANAIVGTVYVTSFYVWTVGEDTVFDMHFDAQGSPSGTGTDYAYNVLKEWSTTHGAYITSCTVDGVATTDSLKGATGGWKKVEIEWTPKATNNVLIMVGDYGGQSNVTGTIYIDDFVTYAKPASYEITVSRFWGAATNTQLVCEYTGTLSGDTFTGTILYNGAETEVNFVPSAPNCFIKTADTNTQMLVVDTESIAVVAGTKMYDAKGNCLTITNNCSYVKNAGGNLVVAPTNTTISTDIVWNTTGVLSYEFTNESIKNYDGKLFTGGTMYMKTNSGTESVLTNVSAIPSGKNLVIRLQGGTSNLTRADYQKLVIKEGTTFSYTLGNEIITIQIANTLSYQKNNSGA